METKTHPDKLKSRLIDAVESFGHKKIVVVGDVMLDQFVWGEVSRISPEAPVPVVEVEKESFLLGGAANVANNLRSLEAIPVLSGVVGTDAFGATIFQICKEKGIDTSALEQDATRPTTLKTRIVARGQQVVRVDREKNGPISESTVQNLKEKLAKAFQECNCIVISDYNKGVICKPVMDFIVGFAKKNNIPTLVDPKPVNSSLYKGATVLTPNKKEAEDMASMPINSDKEIEEAALSISEALELEILLITRGPEGMALWQKGKGLFTIPTMAREVFDVTGAGDTVISLMALGLASDLTPCEAAFLANLAAGIVVGKVGTATVSRNELKDAIDTVSLEHLEK
ncbi:MAG: D-glycero-beta-D-manno-heptose-7-phosphate kinase [Thermodesulfobacteria bacterium]|nr:D-glycero-beta-D-manno-heptose-7-phosphate kinase [Thermodesulfobacteriota bacterium]